MSEPASLTSRDHFIGNYAHFLENADPHGKTISCHCCNHPLHACQSSSRGPRSLQGVWGMARRKKDPTRHMHGQHQAAKSQNPSRIGKSRLGRSLRPAYHAAPPPATRPALGPRGVRHGLTSADPVLSTHARARGWELRLVELGGRVGSMWAPRITFWGVGQLRAPRTAAWVESCPRSS